MLRVGIDGPCFGVLEGCEKVENGVMNSAYSVSPDIAAFYG